MTIAVAIPTTTSTTNARTTWRNLTRSESIKVRSLKATFWCAAALIGSSVLISVIVGLTSDSLVDYEGSQLLLRVTYAIGAGTQIIPIIMGALLAGREYSSGSVRTSLAVVQRRGAWLAAKTHAVAKYLAAASLAAVAASSLVAAAFLRAEGAPIGLTSTAVLQLLAMVVGAVLCGLIGFAFGILLRSTPGALCSGLGLTVIAPMVISIFSGNDIVARISTLLPLEALQNMVLAIGIDGLAFWDSALGATIAMVAWVAVPLAAGYVRLVRTDA